MPPYTLIKGVCHPPPHPDPSYDGPMFNVGDAPDAERLLRGKPVFVEHDYAQAPVGEVLDTRRGPNGELMCVLAVDESSPAGALVAENVRNGSFKGLSIGTKTLAEGDFSAWHKFLINEVSIVHKGAMPNTDILMYSSNGEVGISESAWLNLLRQRARQGSAAAYNPLDGNDGLATSAKAQVHKSRVVDTDFEAPVAHSQLIQVNNSSTMSTTPAATAVDAPTATAVAPTTSEPVANPAPAVAAEASESVAPVATNQVDVTKATEAARKIYQFMLQEGASPEDVLEACHNVNHYKILSKEAEEKRVREVNDLFEKIAAGVGVLGADVVNSLGGEEEIARALRAQVSAASSVGNGTPAAPTIIKLLASFGSNFTEMNAKYLQAKEEAQAMSGDARARGSKRAHDVAFAQGDGIPEVAGNDMFVNLGSAGSANAQPKIDLPDFLRDARVAAAVPNFRPPVQTSAPPLIPAPQTVLMQNSAASTSAPSASGHIYNFRIPQLAPAAAPAPQVIQMQNSAGQQAHLNAHSAAPSAAPSAAGRPLDFAQLRALANEKVNAAPFYAN